MRKAYDQIIEQAFSKLLASQREFVQGEIARFGDVEDKSLGRFRSGPINGGAQQMMFLVDSDFLRAGMTGGSTVVS